MTEPDRDAPEEGASSAAAEPLDDDPIFAPLEDEPAPRPDASPFTDISLSPRQLVGGSFDLMAKAQRDLRNTSFYLGFLSLVTIGPAIALFWAFIVRYDIEVFDPASFQQVGPDARGAAVWLAITFLIAIAGFIVVNVESQAAAIAVLGSRVQGQPLTVTGAVLLARRRFWRVLGASILLGVLSRIAQAIVGTVFRPADLAQAQVGFVVDLAIALLVQTPFIFANAGIVLGEVGVFEALRRSTRLFRARPGLAFTVTLFGVVTQFVLIIGLDAGLGIVFRIAEPFGLGQGGIAIFLGTIIGSVLTFAFGTLAFTAAALAAAPQVIAFIGLTHYVGGLDYARVPYAPRRPWDPFVTVGVWSAIVLGILSLFLGISELA